MALSELIGQEKAVAMLQGILKRKRLAGAYLFSGESGIGKKTAALNFAKAINCLNPPTVPDDHKDFTSPGADVTSRIAAVDSCDACDSCFKINAGAHPDLLMIAPEDRSIRVEEVRAIEEALSFRPFEGRRKVVLVDDADTMNQSAANAFLKTLEEPPEHSTIILISSRPDRLPSTIRSRCSRIPFKTLSLPSCLRVLEGKVPPEELEQTARLCLGRPGLALSTDMKEERDRFMTRLKAMMRAEKDGWASREEIEQWLDLALAYMRDLVVCRITGNASYLINADLADDLAAEGKSTDIQGIIEIHNELSSLKTMLLFNLNKSVTWNYTASMLRKELR